MSLQDSEKAALAKKVGSTASIMSSSFVKLYLASPNPKANKKDPNCVLKNFPDLTDTQWKFTNVMGALVLLVDRVLDTFLFRIYDLEHPHELRFEYELYEDIEYKALDPQFHCFEMDDCMGGFSFCNKEEAGRFLSKVNALKPSAKNNAVDALKGKKKEKKSGGGFFGTGSKKKDKQEVTVSAVTNVTHTQHIGINPDGTFDLNNISPEWKNLFRQAGIKKKDLANPETAKAIVATIAQTTGIQLKSPGQGKALDIDMETAKSQYSGEQLKELEEYQSALKKYQEELAAYEAEQAALAAWERDNAKYLAEKAEKDKQERAAQEKRDREQREKEEAERATKELAELAEKQRLLELELIEKEKKTKEAEAEKTRLLKEAEAKGAKLPPAPPPRKMVIPHVPPPMPVEEVHVEPEIPMRRRASVVQKVIHAVIGPTPEEIAKEEEKRRQEEEEKRKADEERRKKAAEERERLIREDEEKYEAERARIRAEMETQMRAEEEMIRKAVDEQRKRMQEEATREQERMQKEISEAKSAAEKARMEAAAELARKEAERLRIEQEELERKAVEERERARRAAEEAQREQEEIMLQLQVMQMKTLEAKRLVEEEEKRQEELRKEAMKKRAPPIPARLPEKPPLPPPPAAPPKPPQAPALAPLPSSQMKAAGGPPAGGLASVLKNIGTVELKKAENVSDKSGPNITGKMGRDEKKNAFLGALEKGVQLKKVDGASTTSSTPQALPQLQKMESNVQNTIMAKLVETMNMRRGALVGNDSDDDDWSD